MGYFNKLAVLLIVTISLSFISCKGKPGKAGIVGKWAYKELIYTSSKRYKDLSPNQQQRKKEEDDQDAKGTVITFNNDKTYSVSKKLGDEEVLVTGTYEVSEEGEVISKETGKSKTERLKIFSIEKNTLQLQIPSDGMILVLNRIQ